MSADYPNALTEIPQTPLKEVNPLGSSPPGPMQPPLETSAVATETPGRSGCPGDGSLHSRPGFQRFQSSSSLIGPGTPHPSPSHPPPDLARVPLQISAGVQLPSPSGRLKGKASHYIATARRVSSKSYPPLANISPSQLKTSL